MQLIKITPDNVNKYIGYEIIFKTRNNYIIKKIISVSSSCKNIRIDHPDLQNNLDIMSRNIYVII